ncbi:MAG: tRNA lysidine(34) synthetase TilS [Gammaproteobacteria bacterium]
MAFSGGLDSTVLLFAAAETAGLPLRAAHVNHRLHEDADAWEAHCAAVCAGLGVPLDTRRVDARGGIGESPEAAARRARYAALAEIMAPGEALLVAHHADDQLETVLLQLLRGAGVAGIAGMAARTPFGPGELWRPLLGCARSSLVRWARSRGLSWVEDPANRNTDLARNHLRYRVLPALRTYWPSATTTVARSARHSAEAAELLDDLAAIDGARVAAGPGLNLEGLRGLSRPRQRNLLRWYVRGRAVPLPDQRRLETLLDQAGSAGADATPVVRWPGAVATVHRGSLQVLSEAEFDPPAAATIAWPDPAQPLALGHGLGSLVLEETGAGGLDPRILRRGPWVVGFRAGGERLTLPGRRHRHRLKKLFNEAGVPPWERARTPLIHVAGSLAAVGDRWVASEWWSPPGNKALRLSWRR